MFTEATIGIVVVNTKGRILYINRLAEQQFGYEADELIDQSVEVLVPGKSAGMHKGFRQSYRKHPEPRLMGVGRDLEGKRKDGSLFPVEISLSPVEVSGESLAIAFVHDISQRKQTEQLMLREQEKAKTYLEMAGSLILVLGTDQKISLANRAASEILGYPEEELIGKNWFDHFIPEQERETVREVFKKLIDGNKRTVEHYENKIVARSRESRFIRWYNRVIQDESGKITGVISSGVDITEQQKAKAALENYATDLEKAVKSQTEQLRLSAAKLEEASNLTKIGYWEISYKGENPTATFSKEYCQLFGVDPAEPGNDSNYFLQFLEKEGRDRVIALTENAISHDGGNFQYKAVNKSGKEIYLHAEIKCIYNEDQDLETVFGVVQDITEQKQSEFQLEKSLQKERELGQLKSRFVSMASHEFRTPLTSIMSSVSLIGMLNEKGKLEGQRKYIQRIESSVDNLTTILNDFLSLEKLESGKVVVSKTEMDLSSFLEELKDDISSILKPGQQLEHQHEGSAKIFSDPHLMKNILINLLSNAIKYSPENSEIKVHSRATAKDLSIDVIDQGIGIPEEDQKHMFTRFFRANNAANIKGTGLGLTIVKRYLDILGGDISFVSTVNKGTTFNIRIPQ